MDDVICPYCNRPILPGERRIPWFTKDEDQNTTERGALHLHHVTTWGK